jgi:hypothetical protein
LRYVLLASLAAACTAPPTSTIGQAPSKRAQVVAPRFLAHAHNDYEHARPLLDALDAGFRSVEADVYYAGGTLAVSHDGTASKGTLESLYLAPLQERIARNHGSVYGDGKPFRLVIDLKDADDNLPAAVDAMFARYPMLSRFVGGTYVRGPVEIVFTGNEAMKRAVVSQTSWGTRDSNVFSTKESVLDTRWSDYALDWKQCVDWDGTGAMPDDEQRTLAYLVGYAHALHRKIRIYDAPDRPSVWAAECAAGVDFIGTNDLAGLSQFLKTRLAQTLRAQGS